MDSSIRPHAGNTLKGFNKEIGAKDNHAKHIVKVLLQQLDIFARKFEAHEFIKLDLAQAQSYTKKVFAELIEFSMHAKIRASEEEESISKEIRQAFLDQTSRHKRIMIGQLSSSKMDQRFHPEHPLDWARLRHYMNTIDVSQIGMFDPLSRNRIRAINRQLLFSLRFAETNTDPVEKLLQMVFEVNRISKHFPLLLDGLEIGLFTFKHIQIILEYLSSTRAFELLKPYQDSDNDHQQALPSKGKVTEGQSIINSGQGGSSPTTLKDNVEGSSVQYPEVSSHMQNSTQETKDYKRVKQYLRVIQHLLLLHNDCVFQNDDGTGNPIPVDMHEYVFQSPRVVSAVKLVLLDPLIENKNKLIKDLQDPKCKHMYYNIFFMLMSYHNDPMVKSIQTLEVPGYQIVTPLIYSGIHRSQTILDESERQPLISLILPDNFLQNISPQMLIHQRSLAFYTGRQLVQRFKQEFKSILEGSYQATKNATRTRASEDRNSLERSFEAGLRENKGHEILLKKLGNLVESLDTFLKRLPGKQTSITDIFMESVSNHGIGHILMMHCTFLTSEWNQQGFRELIKKILGVLGMFYKLNPVSRGHLFTYEKWEAFFRVSRFAQIDCLCMLIQVVQGYQEILIASDAASILIDYLSSLFTSILSNLGSLHPDLSNQGEEIALRQNLRNEHPRNIKLASLNLILVIMNLLLDTDAKSSKDHLGLIKRVALRIQNLILNHIDSLVLTVLSDPKYQSFMKDFQDEFIFSGEEKIIQKYGEFDSLGSNEYQESWAFVYMLLKTFNTTCKHASIPSLRSDAEFGITPNLNRMKSHLTASLSLGQQERNAIPFLELLNIGSSKPAEPASPVFLKKFSGLVANITGPFYYAELMQLYSHYNIACLASLGDGLDIPNSESTFNSYVISAEVLAGALSIHKDYCNTFKIDDQLKEGHTNELQYMALYYLMSKGQLEPLYKFLKGASLHLSVAQLNSSTIVWQVCNSLISHTDDSPVHKKFLKTFEETARKVAASEDLQVPNKLLKSASTMLMHLDKNKGKSENDSETKSKDNSKQQPVVENHAKLAHRSSVFQRLAVKSKLIQTFDYNDKDIILHHIEAILMSLREASHNIYSSKVLSMKDPIDVFCFYEKQTYVELRSNPPKNWIELYTEGNCNMEDLKRIIMDSFELYYHPDTEEDELNCLKEVESVTQTLGYHVELKASDYLTAKSSQIHVQHREQCKRQPEGDHDEVKGKQQGSKSVYALLSDSTEDNPQASFMLIAYWVMKDLFLLQSQIFSKNHSDPAQKLLAPELAKTISKQDVLFTQPQLVGMLELFDNILIIGGQHIRKLVHDMFFEFTEDDDDDSDEEQRIEQQQHQIDIGRGGLKFLLQTNLWLQRTIITETFDVHELVYSGLYFRLCFLLKSLVEENFTPMKHKIKSLRDNSRNPSASSNLLGEFMAGITLPSTLIDEVSVCTFKHHDRPDLLWYNYVTILTVSENVFGIKDAVKVTSEQIISMLKQLNTICIDVNNPVVLLKEKLAGLIGFLFEGVSELLTELYKSDRLDDMIKPRVMFDQIVNMISLLLFSRDELADPADVREDLIDAYINQYLLKKKQASRIAEGLHGQLILEQQYETEKRLQIELIGPKLEGMSSVNGDQSTQQRPEGAGHFDQEQNLVQSRYNFMQLKWVRKKRLLGKIANMKNFNSNEAEKKLKKFKLLDEFSSPKDILSECYIPRPEIANHRLLTTSRMIYSIMKLISKSSHSREFKVFLTSTEYNVANASGDTATLNLYQSNPSLMQDFKVFRSSEEKDDHLEERGGFHLLATLLFPSKKWNSENIIFGFLKLVSGSVEVRTETGSTTLLDFPILPCCFFISEQTKVNFAESVTIGDHGGRLVDMMESISHFKIEAELNMSIYQKSPILERIVSLDSFKIMMWISWIISFGLNIIALIYLDFSEYKNSGYAWEDEWYWTVLNIGNIFLIVYSLLMACIYLIVRSTENYQKRTKRIFEVIGVSRHSILRKLVLYVWEILKDILMNQEVIVFACFNIVFSTLFLLDSSYFLPFHMLLFASLSKTAKYIIRSITLHVDQLLFTLLLVLIVVYSYSMLIGLYYQSAFDSHAINNLTICESLLSCYCYVLDLGLRNGGGVGDSMVNVPFGNGFFYGKFFMTVTFFIFINLVSLNIIFGIIIDTFSELRKELEEREDEDYRACFICGVDRKDFEKKDKSFDYHKAVEHSLWNYVYFIMYLSDLNELDMTGVESHVSIKLESKSPEWIPRNSTVFLDSGADEDVSEMEQLIKQVIEKVEAIKKSAHSLDKGLQLVTKRSPIEGDAKCPLKGSNKDHIKVDPSIDAMYAQEMKNIRQKIQSSISKSKFKLQSVGNERNGSQANIMQKIKEFLKEDQK